MTERSDDLLGYSGWGLDAPPDVPAERDEIPFDNPEDFMGYSGTFGVSE